MKSNIFMELVYNTTLLLSLSIVYEIVYIAPTKFRRLLPYLSGLLIALTGVVIMAFPFTLQSGIVFDTRSILISVSALIFGMIPTVITVVATIVMRLIMGGIGAIPGIIVIVTSACIGLIWRRRTSKNKPKPSWISIFFMSLCVHVVMLACMLLLPYPVNQNVIKSIALPVLTLYPVASLVLCLLLYRQKALKDSQLLIEQSEEKFKLLFTEAPIGYQSLDENGRLIELNQQWVEIFGYTREEVLGKYFGDVLPPSMRDSFQTQFELFKKSGRAHNEFEAFSKSGEHLYISFDGRVAKNIDGSFKQTHCVLKDITSQVKAETALIESERRYRNIADNISDVVWKTDQDFNITYISPSVIKLIGESPEVMKHKSLGETFPEHSIRYIQSLMERKEKWEEGIKTIEVEQFKADGSLIWIEMNVSINYDQDGVMDGYIGVSRDISQRKNTELALRESERSKSILISNLPGLAYRCKNDPSRTILFVSDGCAELTGYTAQELSKPGTNVYMNMICPEYHEGIFASIRRALQNKSRYNCEYEIITSSGSRKWVLDMGQVQISEKEPVEILEGIVSDIADRKNNENKLKYMSEHDRWTGLYNRDYLEEYYNRDAFRTNGVRRALISVDLSTVQYLTANYGFQYAQMIIKKVADTLSQFGADNRSLFQISENRFVFYLVGYEDTAEVRAFCAGIAETMRAIFASDRIGGGIGAVEIKTDDEPLSIDSLLKKVIHCLRKIHHTDESGFYRMLL